MLFLHLSYFSSVASSETMGRGFSILQNVFSMPRNNVFRLLQQLISVSYKSKFRNLLQNSFKKVKLHINVKWLSMLLKVLCFWVWHWHLGPHPSILSCHVGVCFLSIILFYCGPSSSVGLATDYGLGIPGLNPSRDKIFHPSRPALAPTQPPVHRWFSNWLRVGHSRIESQQGRDFLPVQTGPGAHPASCTMGTGSFPEVKCGQGVLLTTHPLLVLQSWKSRAIPLPTLWDTLGL